MVCSPPEFSLYGIFQERILEWNTISFSRGSPNLGIKLTSSGGFFNTECQRSLYLPNSVQWLSHIWLFATPWTAACQTPVHHQPLEFTQTHVHWVSDAIQPSHSLLSPSPPAFNLSQIRIFSNESVLFIRWPTYWSFSFNISPSKEYSGLISFRIDWFYLLAVQGTLKPLLQHQSSKTSILQCSSFFIIQLSHPYMTTGETIVLIPWTFVGKVMSLFLICCLGWS